MSWLTDIRELLGKFWTRIFDDQPILSGVVDCQRLYAKEQHRKLTAWVDGQTVMRTTAKVPPMPYAVYLERTVQKAGEGKTTLVAHPFGGWAKVLGSNLDFTPTEGSGYVCRPVYAVPRPFCITDHAVDWKHTLYRDVDYTWDGRRLVLAKDPESFGFDVVYLPGEEGCLRSYYRVFGWLDPEHEIKDMVAAFESPDLARGEMAEAAWRLHQQGASMYNVKKMLAAASSSVICDKNGTVDDIWTEQGRVCLSVDGTPYAAPASGVQADVALGADVRAGTVLFGGLKFYTANPGEAAPPAAELPGMLVSTDAGPLVAQNKTEAAIDFTKDGKTYRVLPLAGGDVDNYKEACSRMIDDARCPEVQIPDNVNPLQFICSRLRSGRHLIAVVGSPSLDSMVAALGCVSRSADASGVVSINVKVGADTLSAAVGGFAQPAGCIAVAAYGDLQIEATDVVTEVVP